jgi:hypothetical protein
MIGETGLKINVPLTGTILFLGGSRRDATVDFVIVIGLSRRSSKSEGGCA